MDRPAYLIFAAVHVASLGFLWLINRRNLSFVERQVNEVLATLKAESQLRQNAHLEVMATLEAESQLRQNAHLEVMATLKAESQLRQNAHLEVMATLEAESQLRQNAHLEVMATLKAELNQLKGVLGELVKRNEGDPPLHQTKARVRRNGNT